MAELTYRDAVARGIAQEMTRDPSVVFLGEDVARPAGCSRRLLACSSSSARSASATRRSPSRRSSARRWARP